MQFLFVLKQQALAEGFPMSEEDARITLPLELSILYRLRLPEQIGSKAPVRILAETEAVEIYSSGDIIHVII